MTTQKKNTMMPGMAYPATVLALATAVSYPSAQELFGAGWCRAGPGVRRRPAGQDRGWPMKARKVSATKASCGASGYLLYRPPGCTTSAAVNALSIPITALTNTIRANLPYSDLHDRSFGPSVAEAAVLMCSRSATWGIPVLACGAMLRDIYPQLVVASRSNSWIFTLAGES
jgi:hypothetical protein